MKYYDLKNVLMGLREDYLDAQKKLDEIKDYIDTPYDKDRMTISLDKINETGGYNLGYVYDSDVKRSPDDYNATNSGIIYHLRDDEFESDHMINIKNKKKIREITKDVVNTDFAKNIETTFEESYCFNRSYYNRELVILLGSMLYHVTGRFKPETPKSVIYFPTDDKLYFERASFLGNFNKDLIEETLNAKLPASIFTKYHLDKIEKYENKPIEIINNRKSSNREAYEIIDEPKRLVLKR